MSIAAFRVHCDRQTKVITAGDAFIVKWTICGLGLINYEAECFADVVVGHWVFPNGLKFTENGGDYAGLGFWQYLEKLFGKEESDRYKAEWESLFKIEAMYT